MKRWEVIANWPDGTATPVGLRPRFWTKRGARRFVAFAQEACNRRAAARGIAPPVLVVSRRGMSVNG